MAQRGLMSHLRLRWVEEIHPTGATGGDGGDDIGRVEGNVLHASPTIEFNVLLDLAWDGGGGGGCCWLDYCVVLLCRDVRNGYGNGPPHRIAFIASGARVWVQVS